MYILRCLFRRRIKPKVLAVLFLMAVFGFDAGAQQRSVISGVVVSKNTGLPLQGVSVSLKGTNIATKTDNAGRFSLTIPNDQGILEISFLGHAIVVKSFGPEDDKFHRFALEEIENLIEEVVINTGYQKIPRERATGSFSHIDKELLERRVSSDVLSRLENVVPGLLFNRGDASGTDPFLIRGRGTITAIAQPLIVLDDFPYDGDLNSINPHDIESVSILKDAAAASIWGARAGNGVIVITTKRGRTRAPGITLNTNLTMTPRPDLYNIKLISSEDIIEVERTRYLQGVYDNVLDGPYYNVPLTPVITLFMAVDNDEITLEQANMLIESLKVNDVREDITRHLYHTALKPQYNINIGGTYDQLNYQFSAGYDGEKKNIVGGKNRRVSLRSSTVYKLNSSLSINTTFQYVIANEKSGHNNGFATGGMYPLYRYAQLIKNGVSQPVYLDRPKNYVDTAGNGKLLDWTYRPIDEINNEEHSVERRDMLVNAGVDYNLSKGFAISAKYQFQNQSNANTQYYDEESYYSRNLINLYTQIQPNGSVIRPIPLGGIMDQSQRQLTSHQARIQASLNENFGIHDISAIGGYEIKSMSTTGNGLRYYGYNPDNMTSVPLIDYVNRYPLINSGSTGLISPGLHGLLKLTDNFLSYYANISYSLLNTYTISSSFRKDEANLFGVKANQKGTPLWSLGLAWRLGDEAFIKNSGFVDELKIRATYGVNGNVSRSASAFTTMLRGQTAYSGLPAGQLLSPPNKNLRWEKVKTLNLGVDFSLIKNKIFGTLEYYNKKSTDLLAQAPTDPTLGIKTFYGNVASMNGDGLDIEITSNNVDRGVRWSSTVLFSRNKQRVSEYLMPVSTSPTPYLASTSINPVIGKPLYGVYSYRWGGLEPTTGNPLGYVDGEKSTDYARIYNSTPLGDMVFHGSVQPTIHGAVRNDFTYKNLRLSINIAYKFGSFFRMSSLNNREVISGWGGHADYAIRWQQPNDELTTHVPSIVFSGDITNRDNFYRYSEVLVQKADNIRLDDVSISYELSEKNISNKLPLSSIRFFIYIINPNLVWVANPFGIDPYFNNIPKEAFSVSGGLSLTF